MESLLNIGFMTLFFIMIVGGFFSVGLMGFFHLFTDNISSLDRLDKSHWFKKYRDLTCIYFGYMGVLVLCIFHFRSEISLDKYADFQKGLNADKSPITQVLLKDVLSDGKISNYEEMAFDFNRDKLIEKEKERLRREKGDLVKKGLVEKFNSQ